MKTQHKWFCAILLTLIGITISENAYAQPGSTKGSATSLTITPGQNTGWQSTSSDTIWYSYVATADNLTYDVVYKTGFTRILDRPLSLNSTSVMDYQEAMPVNDSTTKIQITGLVIGQTHYLALVFKTISCLGCTVTPTAQYKVNSVNAPVANVACSDPKVCDDTPLCEFVCNGSFENIGGQNSVGGLLPNDVSQISMACGWNNANYHNGTSDLYNTSSPQIVGIPCNMAGSEPERTGKNSYAGFYVYTPFSATGNADYKESMFCRLKAPLVSGKTYSVSFYLSLSDNSNSNTLSSNVGVAFSDAYTPSTNPNYDINSVSGGTQYFNTSALSNSGWQRYTYTYTPVSANEQFLIIGALKSCTSTAAVSVSSACFPTGVWPGSVYYYIDDVSVTEVANFTVTPQWGTGCFPNITGLSVAPPNAAASYSWSSTPTTSSLSTQTGTNIAVSPTSTTVYSVEAVGCEHIETYTVVPGAYNPTFTALASSTLICPGNTVTLSASSTGLDSFTYTSSPPTASLSSQHSSTVVVSPSVTTTYTIIGSNTSCADTYSATITVSVTTGPTFSISTVNTCINTSITITPTNSTTITYLDPNNGTTDQNPFSYSSPGDYLVYVEGTDACGATGSEIYTVTVVSSGLNPTLTLTPSQAVCAGTTKTLIVGGATTYTWVTGSHSTSITVTPTVTTTYTVIGATSCGSSTAAVTISVTPVPSLTVTVNPTAVCSGQSATLTANGASFYNWSTTETINPIIVTPSITTTYTVLGGNACGTNSTIVTVTVNVSPSLTLTASSSTICAGSTATLTASGATTYSWSTTATVSVIAVSPSISTVYTVTGNNAGCTDTKIIQVEVDANPVINATPSTHTICPGGSATLTASGGTSYTWSPGGANTLTISVTPSVSTVYTLSAATTACGVKSNTVLITVNSPTVTAIASPTSVCSGVSTTLTASGANTYTWDPGGIAGASAVVTPTIINISTKTIIYTVTATDAAGCIATNTVGVLVKFPIFNISGSSFTICAGTTKTLTATQSGFTYDWQPVGASGYSVVVSPSVTTVYSVTGTSTSTGCSATKTINIVVNPFTFINVSPPSICAGQSATLNVPGATSYTWSTGAGTSSIVVSPTTTTSYTVTGTGGTCTSSLIITVTVNPVPTVTASASPTAICSGQSATLTAGGATTYSWNPGGSNNSPLIVSPGSTTVYTVIGTSLACSNTATVSVNVSPTPTVSIVASASIICKGSSATFTASGASSYSWTTGATTSSITVTPTPTPAVSNYTVYGTTGSCTSSATISLIAIGQPTITATASPSTICAGESSTLRGFGGIPGTYTWTPGSLNINPLTASPSATTVYTVTAWNKGCSSSGTVQVTVNPVPSLSISVNPTLTCLGSATLTASGATAYTWNPGAVSSATAVVSPTATTVYTVTGTNTVGCSSTATVSVEKDDSYCCRPSVKTFTTGSISTQTNVTSMGAVLVEVTGTLTINTSTFDFTNTLIRMAPNAKLIVAPSCSVTLSSAHLFSCDNMWEGIELKDDSRLLANTAASSPSPTLDDAHTAIYVDATGMTNPATIDLTDLVLSKNRVGIKIANSSGSSAYPLSMSAVTLQGDVATPYSPGTTLKPYIGGSGTVTFPSTEYGVQAVNVEAITVGSSAGGSRNTFRSMQNGVRLEQSNAHVERCDFMDFGTAYNNKGIWAAGDLTSPSSPPGYVYYGTKHRFLVGQGTGNDCSFTNLKYGIYSDSCMTSYIQDNTFNDINGTGIAVYRCNFIRGIELTPTMIGASDRDTAYVYNNTMAPLGAGANLMQNGVGMFENYYLKGIIYANSMDLKPATGVWSEGVGIYHSTTNYSSSYTTTGNLITGVGNYGIHEENDASVDPGTIPRAIESNTITVGTGSCSGSYNTANVGVYCENSPLSVIKENIIDETAISGMPSCMIGIAIDNGNADYLGCNLIKNSGLAIAVKLNNLNSVCRGNVMDQALAGIYLGNGTMGDIGASGDAAQNEWYSVTNDTYVKNAIGGDIIYYDNSISARNPVTNVGVGAAPFVPVLTTTASLGCTQYHRGSSSLIQLNDNNNDLVTDLINSTVSFPQYHEGLLWEHRYGILSLLKDSLLDNGNPVFAQFRQDQDNTNLGRINSLMRSLGHYADVLAHSSSYGQSLGAISTNTNVVEQNYKLFMGAYINYVAGGANESAYSSIQQLAQQCPYSDGAVVYNARALMKLWGDETLYRNNCEAIDIQPDDQLKLAGNTEQNSKAENVLVYPNPNSGSFSIAYTFTQLKNTFELYDLVGRKVMVKALRGIEGIENISLDETDNGVYFYKVSDANGKSLFTGKLIISK